MCSLSLVSCIKGNYYDKFSYLVDLHLNIFSSQNVPKEEGESHQTSNESRKEGKLYAEYLLLSCSLILNYGTFAYTFHFAFIITEANTDTREPEIRTLPDNYNADHKKKKMVETTLLEYCSIKSNPHFLFTLVSPKVKLIKIYFLYCSYILSLICT